MKLGEAQQRMAVDTIPTGSIALDIALGVGGVPRGRVLEVFGPESSGKTTLVQHVIAEAQRMGGTCAIIDAEHALDPAYARRLGVDVDNLFISQPDSAEQALEIAEALVRSAAFDVVAIDSVAALVPRAELEGEMGDSHVGLQARLMSQALRKLTGAINRSRTSLIFTNQLREKVGVMFGNPETTPGGRALKFYASVRLDVRRIDSIKQGTDVVGSRVKVKVVKNKVAPPFRVAEFDIMYNEGISKEGGLLDLAVELGLVKKTGAFFSYGETRLGQGRENAREFLKNNAEMAGEIEGEIRRQTLTGGSTSPRRPPSTRMSRRSTWPNLSHWRKLDHHWQGSPSPVLQVVLSVCVLCYQQVAGALIFSGVRLEDVRYACMALIAQFHGHTWICFEVAHPVGAGTSARQHVDSPTMFREPDLDAVPTPGSAPDGGQVQERFACPQSRPSLCVELVHACVIPDALSGSYRVCLRDTSRMATIDVGTAAWTSEMSATSPPGSIS